MAKRSRATRKVGRDGLRLIREIQSEVNHEYRARRELISPLHLALCVWLYEAWQDAWAETARRFFRGRR